MAAQIISGLLKNKKKVLSITESNVKDYINKLKSITFDFSSEFIANQLAVLPLHVYGKKWSKKNTKNILPFLTECINNTQGRCDCVVIDSLSLLTIYSSIDHILDFFIRCNHLISSGMTIIITIHEDDIPLEISKSVKGMADVFLKLKSTLIGTKAVKTVEIVKLLGAHSPPENEFAFEVDMTFGIKIVPISIASA